jgi:hypothetical protein
MRAREPLVTLLLLGAAALGARAEPLPDIRPEIDQTFVPIRILRNQTVPDADVAEGCAGATTGRTLIRFTLTTVNEGTADVVLGDPGCPICVGDPPPVCSNELFECSVVDGHHHAHFSRYALYELLPRADAPAAAVGRKQGFCIEDTLCDVRTYDCDFQGLAVGCQDVYFHFLGCQYVDATDVPGGRYLLRVHVNFARIILESRYDNNTDEEPVELCDTIRAPSVRLAHLSGRPGRWRAKGEVIFARPPLVENDPPEDGALVRLGLDGAPLLEVAVPPGGRGTGCDPRDGWRGGRRGTRWAYTNVSGHLDPACSLPARGLERLAIRRTPEGFAYSARGRVAHAAALPAEAATTVVMGRVTGPCGAAPARTCVRPRHAPDGVVCTGSPSGAFADALVEAW